jgi:hypothetical protein
MYLGRLSFIDQINRLMSPPGTSLFTVLVVRFLLTHRST